MIPAALRELEQWAGFRSEARRNKDGSERTTKVPYTVTGPRARAKADDPATWAGYEQAIAAVEAGRVQWPAFFTTAEDGILLIDLDDCISEDGLLHPDAAAIVAGLDTFTELSQSGSGMHVIGYGAIPDAYSPDGRGRRKERTSWGGKFEAYQRERGFAITGNHLRGTPEDVREIDPARLEQVFALMFGPAQEPAKEAVSPSDSAAGEPVEQAGGKISSGRWDALKKMAGTLVRATSNAEVVAGGLLAFNAAELDPPYPESEVRRLAGDALGWAIADTGERGEFELPTMIDLWGWEWLERPLPELQHLLGDYLVRGERLLIGGTTGHGKTMFALQAIGALLAGEPFLDALPTPGDHYALVLDLEQSESDIHRCLRESGVELERIRYVSISDGLELDRNPLHVATIEEILSSRTWSVVLIGPLYKAHRGDSNDERAATDLMRLLDRWRARYGFALVMDVHRRKELEGRSGFKLDDLFGSGAYMRGAERIFGIERKAHGIGYLHVFKDRSGMLEVPSRRKLTYKKGLGFDLAAEDGEERDYAADVRRYLAEPSRWLLEHEQARASGWLTVKEIAKGCSIREQRVKLILDELAEEGFAESMKAPSGRSGKAIGWRTCFRSPGDSKPLSGGGVSVTTPPAADLLPVESSTAPTAPTYIEQSPGSSKASRLLKVVKSTPGLRKREARKQAGLDIGEFYAALNELRERGLIRAVEDDGETRLYEGSKHGS